MASLTRWTGVWANSGRWWRTGRPGVRSPKSWTRLVTERQQKKEKASETKRVGVSSAHMVRTWSLGIHYLFLSNHPTPIGWQFRLDMLGSSSDLCWNLSCIFGPFRSARRFCYWGLADCQINSYCLSPFWETKGAMPWGLILAQEVWREEEGWWIALVVVAPAFRLGLSPNHC